MGVFILSIFVAYLVGSIPTSYIVGRALKGIDLRKYGSGNLGATNAFRILGWETGLFVLICDILKGVFPVLILPGIIRKSGFEGLAFYNIQFVIGLGAILGHVFTIFMKFKGGKGVATSLGVFMALAWKPVLITLVVCIIVIVLTRYVSAGSLVGAVLLPILMLVFHRDKLPLVIFTALIGLVIIIRHRGNLKRLLSGRENKLFT